MKTQQTMKVFIASSSEMHHERIVLSDLFADMSTDNMIYQPVKWEYVDKALRTERKEDQYLQRLHDCDVCITMLWKSLGQYTVEEFNDAINRQKNGDNPKKVFVLIKKDKSEVDSKLGAFIDKLQHQHNNILYYFSNDSELKRMVGVLLTTDVVDSVENPKVEIPVKDVYVMVAADGELNEDTMEFADVIAHLNEVLVSNGIRLHRVKWSQGVINEFMQKVNNCEMCLNLYWRDLPENSSEEINRSFNAMLKGDNPQHLYIFFKEPCDKITNALSKFKNSFETEYGHFYCRYENVDTMCLHFILQLMLLKNGLANNMINNEGGYVMVGNLPMVNLNKIPFAQYNKDFQRMSERLYSFPVEIEQALALVDKYPNDPVFEQQLQEKLDKYNELKKEFNQYQKFLFDVAKRITQLQGDYLTNRMRRAIEAFNNGNVYRANIILDEAVEDAKNLLENYKMHKIITEEIRNNIYNAIDEIMLATATIMADAKQPIEERIARVKQLYLQADEMANEVNLDKKKHIKLLGEYALFVTLYCSENVQDCEKAIALDKRLIELADNSKGEFELSIADSYERIGTKYNQLREYKQSLFNHKRAFTIRKKLLGPDNPVTTKYYNNIGVVYIYRARKGDFDKAYANLEKAAEKWEMDSNSNAALLATVYNNLSIVCMDNDILYVQDGEMIGAVGYAKKSVSMCRKAFGRNHFETAGSYDTLAQAFMYYGDASYKNNGDSYDFCLVNKKALICLFIALSIELEMVGYVHQLTFHTVYSIGTAYLNLFCCQEAIAFFNKALEIDGKIHYLTEYGKEELINSIDEIKSKLPYTVGTKDVVSFSDWKKLANAIDLIAIEDEDTEFSMKYYKQEF